MAKRNAGKVKHKATHSMSRGYLTKLDTARLHPEVQPFTLLYAILAENLPLLYTFYGKRYPFYVPTCGSVF